MRIQKEEKKLVRTGFTKEEISQLRSEVKDVFSQENKIKWLEAKGAIKMRIYSGKPDMVVIQKQDGSFPYSNLSDLWDAATFDYGKKEFADRKNMESLDNTSQTVNKLFID